MKQIKKNTLTALMMIFTTWIYSQSVQDAMSNLSMNYYEKLTYIETNKATVLENATEEDQKRYYRWRAFWDSRIDEKGNYDSYINAIGTYQTGKSSTSKYWKSIGPDFNNLQNWFYVGKAESIWVNPNDTSVIYLGSNNGGLWKTENGGKNWRLLTEEFAFGVNRIVVHPDNQNIMFVASGDYANGMLRYGKYGQGVFKSTDAGETWLQAQQISQEDMIFMTDIVIHPLNHNIVFAISGKTLYKSVDTGEHWEQVTGLSTTNDDGFFYDLEINPVSPDNMVISGNNELQRSTDGGSIWTDEYDDLAAGVESKVKTDYMPNGDLLALYYTSGNDYLKISTDDGDTWTTHCERNFSANGTVQFLEIVNDTLIWAGGTRPLKSNDGGITFDWMDNGYYGQVHPDVRDICFPLSNNLNVVYLATDGGIERNLTTNPLSWDILNGDLVLNECYTVSFSHEDPEIMLIGTHDNGTYKRYSDGTWKHVKGGDGGTTLISRFNNQIMFCNDNQNIYISHNGGDTWPYNFSVPTLDSPVLQHPTDHQTFFIGKWGINISQNSGQTWNSFGTFGQGGVTAMAISESNPDYFYAAKQNVGINYFGKKNRF